jgi:hypothetical protein
MRGQRSDVGDVGARAEGAGGGIGKTPNGKKEGDKKKAIHALSLAGRPIFLQGPGHGGYRDHKTDTCSSCHYFVAILFGIAIGVMGAAAANTN